jgi:hypothetical protein
MSPSAEKGLLTPGDPDWRMDAYYYGFEPTGIGVIDAILSTVAQAGKGYHHTDSWSDEYDWDYGLIRKGESSADAIQRAANEAAAAIRASVISPGVSDD